MNSNIVKVAKVVNPSNTATYYLNLSKVTGKLWINKAFTWHGVGRVKSSVCATVKSGNTLVPTDTTTKSQAKWLQNVLKTTDYKLRIPKTFKGYTPASTQ